MKKIILLISILLLMSCSKDEDITTPEENLETVKLTTKQLYRAWPDIASNDPLYGVLEKLSQENVVVTDTWDRKGRNSRQAYIIIPKFISSELPTVDDYSMYDSDTLTGFGGAWVAFVRADGNDRTIANSSVILTSITVEPGVVYTWKDGGLIPYND